MTCEFWPVWKAETVFNRFLQAREHRSDAHAQHSGCPCVAQAGPSVVAALAFTVQAAVALCLAFFRRAALLFDLDGFLFGGGVVFNAGLGLCRFAAGLRLPGRCRQAQYQRPYQQHLR